MADLVNDLASAAAIALGPYEQGMKPSSATQAARDAAAAVLRCLAEAMRDEGNDDDWPTDWAIDQIADELEDDEWRRQAMLTRRTEVLAANPDVRLARNLAPLMGEFEREYWSWSLEGAEAEVNRLRTPYVEITEEAP